MPVLDINLETAIQKCTHGLAFTNNRWADSDYCNKEIRNMLEYLPIEKIQEICIPLQGKPHEYYPELKNKNPLVLDGDVEILVGQIIECLSLPANYQSKITKPVKRNVINFKRFGASVDLGPFEIATGKTKKQVFQMPGHYQDSIFFDCRLNGKEVGLIVKVAPFDSTIDRLSIEETGETADREVYYRYREYANSWAQESNLTIRGLHLFFVGGRSHMALTYATDKKGSLQRIWERRYVITIKGENSGEEGELHLTFYETIEGSEQEQFMSFCALCKYFDELAESVQYQTPSGAQAVANTLPIALAKVVYIIASFYLMGFLIWEQTHLFHISAAVILSGILLGDLTLFLFSPIYQRLAWISIPIYEDTQKGRYERFSLDLYSWLSIQPIAIITSSWVDFRVSLGFVGDLWIPGPSLMWAGISWFGTAGLLIPILGLSFGIVFGILLGMICGVLVMARYVALHTKRRYWRDLWLR